LEAQENKEVIGMLSYKAQQGCKSLDKFFKESEEDIKED